MKITAVQTAGISSLKKIIPDKSQVLSKNNGNTSKVCELSNFYYMPVSFSGKPQNRTYSSSNPQLFEIPSNFQICKYDNVPCPACGRKMLTREKYAEFKKEIESVDESEYINVLERWQDYMMPVEHSAFQDIKQNIAKSPNPEKPNDIRTAVVNLRNTSLPQLQAIQMQRVKKMRSLAKTLPEDEQKVLLDKLIKLQKIIKKTGEESPFRRKIMIDKISRIKISNPYKYKKLQRIAASFPTSNDIDSAWIVKYSGKNKQGEDWTSEDIALRLLVPSIPNTDHILSYSAYPGNDDITNYLAMHTGCNSKKADKSFLQWYYENKNTRQQSLESYFNRANELISSGELNNPKYKDYVAKATQTILEASQGKVDLTQ